MESKAVKVPNISCGHCANTIKREVGELEGVVSVSVDIDIKLVTIEWGDPASWDAIEGLLREINYPPEA
jgi:copper chaperone CopZ